MNTSKAVSGIVAFLPVPLVFYGLARLSTNPFQITLVDTDNVKYSYELNAGIFWDSAQVKKTTGDPPQVSVSNYRSIRHMEISHQVKK